MTSTGIGINSAGIVNAVATGTVAEAEAKLRKVDEALSKASKEWDEFGSGAVVKAVNSGRTLSPKETTDLIIGVIKLVRGTAFVLAAEKTALAAAVQAIKSVNMKR